MCGLTWDRRWSIHCNISWICLCKFNKICFISEGCNMSNIYYTNVSFEPATINPFSENKPYESNWIMVKLLEDADYFIYTGGGQGSVFQVIITKKCVDWKLRIMDFIQYEISYNKNIIAAVSKHDLEIAKKEYTGHHYMDKFLRPYEQRVLVHSTTLDSWQSINNDGCLKSWNLLKRENKIKEEKPIGEKLGDPHDYSDYIMFTNGGVAGEIVVSSKQKGRIEMDIDMPYKPGARLYFDTEKIANDGLLIRDGAHMKVRDKLYLEKYLICVATLETVDLKDQEVTPRKFANECDRVFQEKYGVQLG